MVPGSAEASKDPPEKLPDEGILLGYSLEHERRTAPIGFTYGTGGSSPGSDETASPTLDPIIHTGGGHLMTIAPTGGGKGVSCIIPTLLRFPGPVIVIDPKGENYAVTAARRRALGQQVVVLDPIGITGAPEVGALNPLDLVDSEEAQSIDDSASLASLMSGGAEKDDPRNVFWYQRGEQLLTGVIQFVAIVRPPEHRHLGEVRRILNLPTEQFIQLAQTEMASCPDPNVQQVAGTLANPAEETIGSILAMSQNSVGFLRGQLLHESTSSTSFDLGAITAGDPLSIFIVIPPDKLESHRNLLRLWIGTLMSALMRRRAPVPHSTLLVLDEAAQLGPLEQLRQAITLMRGYGLQTWSFWQDVSQLRNLYSRDWETMYNNCRVHQAFGFTTLKAAATTCDLLGFYDPLEALRLDSDEMILTVSGDESVIAQKPNYLTDPAFRSLYSPNPFYTRSPDVPPRPRRPKRVYIRPALEPLVEDSAGASSPAAGSQPPTEGVAELRVEDTAGQESSFDLQASIDAADDLEDEWDASAPVPSRLEPLPGVEVGYASTLPEVLEPMVDRLGGSWNPITAQHRLIRLSFYPKHEIVEVFDPTHGPKRQLLLRHQNELRTFTATASSIGDLNRSVPIQLTDDNVAEYVRFFFHFARPRDQRVRIVENVDQLEYWTGTSSERDSPVGGALQPLRVTADANGGWRVEATTVLGTSLAELRASVASNGEILEVEQTAVSSEGSFPPTYPQIGLDGEPLDPSVLEVLAESHGTWEVLGPAERTLMLDGLATHLRQQVPNALPVFRRTLRCYPTHDLIVVPHMTPELGHRVYFHRPGSIDHATSGIDSFNEHYFDLSDARAAEEYLRFYHWYVSSHSDDAHLVLDRLEQLPLDSSFELDPVDLERLQDVWTPVKVLPSRKEEHEDTVFRFQAMVLKGRTVFPREYSIRADGSIYQEVPSDFEMKVVPDEEMLVRLRMLPSLGPGTPGTSPAPDSGHTSKSESVE